jgi:hypothetical protein
MSNATGQLQAVTLSSSPVHAMDAFVRLKCIHVALLDLQFYGKLRCDVAVVWLPADA